MCVMRPYFTQPVVASSLAMRSTQPDGNKEPLTRSGASADYENMENNNWNVALVRRRPL
jgi:hypothetical protein